MSVVYLRYHNENVQDLERNENIQQPQNKRYNSRYSAHVRNESRQRQLQHCGDGTLLLSNANKHDHRTMGLAQTPLQTPHNFLRKNCGVKWLRQTEHMCVREPHLPPLPRFEASSAPVCRNKRSCHNFIAHNIAAIKNCAAKPPIPRFVDTPKGARHELINTGLIPQFVQSARYGKVPAYIIARKHQLQQQAEHMQQRQNILQQTLPFGVRQMSQEERRNIIYGLKTNYSNLSKAYQKLSLFTDTVAKKQQKTNIENQLRQLEQDILLMEGQPTIYISQY